MKRLMIRALDLFLPFQGKSKEFHYVKIITQYTFAAFNCMFADAMFTGSYTFPLHIWRGECPGVQVMCSLDQIKNVHNINAMHNCITVWSCTHRHEYFLNLFLSNGFNKRKTQKSFSEKKERTQNYIMMVKHLTFAFSITFY